MSIFSVGVIILSVIFIRWIISLKSIGFHNISQSQKDNLWYILIFGSFGISLLLITAIFTLTQRRLYANFYIIITYLEGIVSVCLVLFENRAAKSEVLSMKDVSDTNVMFLY
jgi:hypothetical protein